MCLCIEKAKEKDKNEKMKLTTVAIPLTVALGAKVPRDSPVRKILKLKRFANEWLIAQFGADSKVHKHWMQKITRNALRFKVSRITYFNNC